MTFIKGHKDIVSKEARKRAGIKISKSLKGRKLTLFHRKRISESHKGIKQSPETIAKRIASRKGYRHSKKTIKKIRLGNLGKKRSKKVKEKLRMNIFKSPLYRYWLGKKRLNISGQNNWKWKGNKVGYYGIHDWIEKEKGKAKNHKCTLEDKSCKGKMTWSNISKKYLRKLSDWRVLCKSHHWRYDITPKIRKKISKTMKNKSHFWSRGKNGKFIKWNLKL